MMGIFQIGVLSLKKLKNYNREMNWKLSFHHKYKGISMIRGWKNENRKLKILRNKKKSATEATKYDFSILKKNKDVNSKRSLRYAPYK